MVDIATLQIKVEQKGTEQANSALGTLTEKSQRAANAQKALELQTKRLEVAEQRLQAATLQASNAQESARQAAQRLENQNKKLQDQTEKNTASVGGLINSLKAFATGYVVQKVINTADSFKLLQARIQNATDAGEDFSGVFKSLQGIAGKTGSDLEGVVAIYQRLSMTRKEIKATTEEMLQFTETVSKLGVLSGASGDSMKFGLTQLGQSLSSNIVRAEEFNSIMENIPAVGGAIAEQMGITTGQLRMLVINGQVLSKDVFAAILNHTEKVNEQFSQFPKTVGMAFRQAQIEIMNTIGLIDETSGATDSLSSLVWGLGKVFRAVGVLASGVFQGIRSIMLSLASGITAIVQGAVHSINWLIEQVNKVPGVNIGKLSTEGVDNFADSVYKATSQSFENMDKGVQGGFDQIMKDIQTQTGGGETKSSGTRQLSQDYKKLAEGLNAASKAGKGAADKLSEVDAAAKAADDRAKQLQKTFEDFGQKATDSLKAVFNRTMSLKDGVRSLIEYAQNALFDQVIGNGLSSMISGGLSSMFGATIPGTGGIKYSSIGSKPSQSSGGGFGDFFSSAASSIGSLFGFATGGEFKVGGFGGTDSQLVAFRASPNETVSVSRGGETQSSGGGITINVDARGAANGVGEEVKAAIRAIDASIETRALNAVSNANRRDGSFLRR